MDEKIITPLKSLFRRTALFLRDFLPENNLQLLFPLASLVLYVGGASPWLPPGHILVNPELQHQDGTLWFDISTRLLMLRYYAILYAVILGFLGSIALWCLPARRLVGRFVAWVLLPIAVAILSFLTIVLRGGARSASLLEPPQQVLQEHLHDFPTRLLLLGRGFYITLLGLALLTGALWIAHVFRVPLPVRFRGQFHSHRISEDDSSLSRRIFALVIVASVIAVLIDQSILIPMVPAAGKSLPWYDNWPRNFAAWRWLPELLISLAVAACAVLVLRGEPKKVEAASAKSLRSSAAIAFLLPLAIALLPRLVLKALFEFSTVLSNVPYEFVGFRVFPWVLILFVVAALEEFTLRLYLQNPLEQRLGFKRACLLIPLLWWLLPLGDGFGPFPSLRFGIPGVSVVVGILVLILYNIPLAWLWSRTRSLWLVTLMHGTILLFRAGDPAYGVYFTFPYLYWIETSAWIVIIWYLFKKWPLTKVTPAIDHRPA